MALPLTASVAIRAHDDAGSYASPQRPVRAATSDRELQVINAHRERSVGVRQLRWYSTVVYQYEVARMQRAQQRREMWETLARCENGGDWTVVDRFGGGLGIYIGTWQMFDGEEFASNPGYATNEQQIIVAERIYARYGLSGWGCAHTLGWLD